MKISKLIQIKQATRILYLLSEKQKNLFLNELAISLQKNTQSILKANIDDVGLAIKNNRPESFIQRLKLSKNSISSISKKLQNLQIFRSYINEIIEEKNLQNILLQKVRTPLGVIVVIFEARPEVVIDVVALCIKSSNAVILKGGSDANNTICEFVNCIQTALDEAKIDKSVVCNLSTENRSEIHSLITQDKFVDLVIARGGYEMVKAIMSRSTIPVLAHSSGGARIYIDKSADVNIVENILVNAKTSKPSACNSLDTIVVHEEIVDQILPIIDKVCKSQNIKIVKNVWNEEFLDLKLSVKIVKNHKEAIDFISKFSNHHSEGIMARDKKVIREFTNSIDSASLFVNCTTRLHDGYEFGLGAEMGIATGKLHARGPVGIDALTSYKWIAYGK